MRWKWRCFFYTILQNYLNPQPTKSQALQKKQSSTPKCRVRLGICDHSLQGKSWISNSCQISMHPTDMHFYQTPPARVCCGFLFLKYVEGAVLFGVWDGFQNEVHTYRTIQSCAWGFFSVSWMLRTIPPFAQMVGGLRLWLSSKKQSS